MDRETIVKFAEAAIRKADLLRKHPARYFLLSMLAGAYVGLGIILIFSIGAPLKAANSPFLKVIMGASFSLALTLVIFAGSELFTGNNMVMLIGNLEKKVRWTQTAAIWGMSYLGNLVGSLLLALAMAGTGFLNQSPMKDFVVSTTAAKMTAPFSELFFRGLLCNMLVCLAVWTATRAKEEIARLVLIFWCLFGFIGAGFEHSVANMTLLGMGLFAPHAGTAVSWSGFAANLVPVSLGNIVGGGIIIGGFYWLIGRKADETGETSK